ncbi:MAG: hypothetical protein JJT95_05980 [Pararhodobacter sp.]|nr:hypothetical protein [Pararhodobacter sp.]
MNEDHVFPPEWEWKRYEPVMREWMAQCARIIDEQKRVPEAQTHAHQMLSEHWRSDQEQRGHFPPFEEREKYGEKYIKCLDRLLKEAQDDLRAGRLRNGQEHLSRRNQRWTLQQQGAFDLTDWDNVRPEDLDQTLKTRIMNKLVNACEELEVKKLERRRRRRR